jgi:small conductance mechanosensitive channel
LVVAIIIFVVMLLLARWSYRLVRSALQKREVDPEVTLLLARITQISIIVLGTIWALATVDFNVTGFVAGLGIVGFTVGFALKDIAENFVAGVLLLLQQPFDIGDAIEAGGFSGTVINIEIRSTTIRTWDGLMVIVPNSAVYTNAITNYSKVDQRRINLDVGVGYESDLQKVDDLMVEVANGLSGVKEDPAPFVVFKEFGDSSINATLYFWIDTSEAAYFDTLDAATKGVKEAFDREGINIPFPIRTVFMQQAG